MRTHNATIHITFHGYRLVLENARTWFIYSPKGPWVQMFVGLKQYDAALEALQEYEASACDEDGPCRCTQAELEQWSAEHGVA